VAKANLVLPNGTTVAIEGTVPEAASLVGLLSDKVEQTTTARKQRGKLSKQKPSKAITKKKGPLGHITELEQEGFFKAKRTLSAVQKKLEETGHFYAQTSLSPTLVRLVRKRLLRRIKEKNGWVYVS